MATEAAKKVRAKRQRRPVYFHVERMVRPDTGESIGCLVPDTKWDVRIMRDRKYHIGTQLRAELKKPRNIGHHRLSHALANMLIESVDEFAGKQAHDVLKQLQAESGASCETVEYDIPNVGKLTRNEPRSLSFDEMDEGEFSAVMKTIYLHIQAKYFPSMSEDQIAVMVEAYEVQH
jgi:hypothetical protein